MSKPTAPVITYEYDVRNIPVFVENDDDEEEVPEQEEELNPRGNQKLLTRNRLVHDIDSALDQNNYDPIHYIQRNGHWETLTRYLGLKIDKKNRNDNLDQYITKSNRQTEKM